MKAEMMLALRRRLGEVAALIAARQRRRGASGQRGAVLVEAAIALPMVTLLLFGILEYGLLFGDGMDLASAIRAGSRTGAAMATVSSTTDYQILQSVKTTGGRVSTGITRVVIYKADGPDGAPGESCRDGIAEVGECNVYSSSDLNLSEAALAQTGDSQSWPPDSRLPGTDYLGVWASADHKWITGLLGRGRTVVDSAVMRVQPLPTTGEASDNQYWPLPEQTSLATSSTTTTTVKTTTTTTTAKTTTTTAKSGTTTTTAVKATTTSTTPKATTTTAMPSTTTTVKPTTTTVKPTTTTTIKPTTTTAKPTTTTTTPLPPHF